MFDMWFLHSSQIKVKFDKKPKHMEDLIQEDLNDLLIYINEQSKKKGLVNRLYAIKKINGKIFGRVCLEGQEVYWLPKCQLCSYHEKLIDAWEKSAL